MSMSLFKIISSLALVFAIYILFVIFFSRRDDGTQLGTILIGSVESVKKKEIEGDVVVFGVQCYGSDREDERKLFSVIGKSSVNDFEDYGYYFDVRGYRNSRVITEVVISSSKTDFEKQILLIDRVKRIIKYSSGESRKYEGFFTLEVLLKGDEFQFK